MFSRAQLIPKIFSIDASARVSLVSGGLVVFDAGGTEAHSGVATTFDYSNLTISAGLTNSALIAHICFYEAPTTGVTVVWDPTGANQSLTQLGSVSAGGSFGQVELWGLVNPVAGNKVIRVTWTSAATRVFVCGTSWSGVNQTGGATSFPNATTNTGSGTTTSVTVTSGVGHAVVAEHSDRDGTVFVSIDPTEVYHIESFTTNGSNRAAGAASVTLHMTFGSNPWASIGTDIAPA